MLLHAPHQLAKSIASSPGLFSTLTLHPRPFRKVWLWALACKPEDRDSALPTAMLLMCIISLSAVGASVAAAMTLLLVIEYSS